MTTPAFEARMVSPEEMIRDDMRFLIPLYQRLYVWKPEQVQRMMDDIIAAWCQAKDRRNEVCYLGGILAIRRFNKDLDADELELIDGQQRLTTLWLLALAWSDDPKAERLAEFIRAGESMKRIRFAVREGAGHFVETALAGKPEGCPETRAMEDALKVLLDYPHNATEFGLDKSRRGELAEFILHNVRFALTEVPDDTDLNKLFEVINNRGQQLQHYDILKKRLLERITEKSEQEAYARIWDACAAMDDYVERNFAQVHGEPIKVTVERWDGFERKPLSEVQVALDALAGSGDKGGDRLLSLEEILEAPWEGDKSGHDISEKESNEASVESIISFPMLLQHTLRLFRHRKEKSDIDHINDKDLLAVFGKYFFSDDKPDAKAFIELLWRVRVAFDDYVVKWVERDEDDRQLDVRRIRPSEGSYPRSVEGVPRGLSLLQAVIYHSLGKTTQYWLTPFLDFCLTNPETDEALVYLKYLDHCLLTLSSDGDLLQRSHRFLEESMPVTVKVDIPAELRDRERNGTAFRHYWFYKTEYVLWENIEYDKYAERELPADFRIVSRNSVEHIAPQHSLERYNVAGEWLNAFANLALINREMNSRFSNDIFQQKKEKYWKSTRRSPSLMLKLVFDYKEWTTETIENHQSKLEEEWRGYLRRLADQVDGGFSRKDGLGAKDVKGR